MMSTGAEANSRSMPGTRPLSTFSASTTATTPAMSSSTSRSRTRRGDPVTPGPHRTGCRWAPPAPVPRAAAASRAEQPGLGAVERDRDVGLDHRIGRHPAAQVDRGRGIDRQHRHARGTGTHDRPRHRPRWARGGAPRTPVPSRASMTRPARSMPLSIRRTSREVAAWMRSMPSMPSSRSQLASASRVAGRPSVDASTTTLRMPCRGKLPRGDQPIATVVARARQHEHLARRRASAGTQHGARHRGHRGACLLHQRVAADAQALGTQVRAAHAFRGDGRECRARAAHHAASMSRSRSGRCRRAILRSAALRGRSPPDGRRPRRVRQPGRRAGPPVDRPLAGAGCWPGTPRTGRALVIRRLVDPYAIWIAETMSQQTQIGRVGEALPAFLARFPDVRVAGAARSATCCAPGAAWAIRAARSPCARRPGELVRRSRRRAAGATWRRSSRCPASGPYTARAVAATAFGVPGHRPGRQRPARPRPGAGRSTPGRDRARASRPSADALAPARPRRGLEPRPDGPRRHGVPADPRLPGVPAAADVRLGRRCAPRPHAPTALRRRRTASPFRDTNRYARGRVLREPPRRATRCVADASTRRRCPSRRSASSERRAELQREGLIELDDRRARSPADRLTLCRRHPKAVC